MNPKCNSILTTVSGTSKPTGHERAQWLLTSSLPTGYYYKAP